MPTKVKDRRKSTRVSSGNSKSSSSTVQLPRIRYIGEKKKRKDTRRINHPNFVSPLTQNFVDISQNNLNITKNNYFDNNMTIDYVQFVKHVYPQVKDYLYIFEHELSSKHLDPKEFALWIFDGLKELNQTNDIIAFDYNTFQKKYIANIVKPIEEFQGGYCVEMCWMNKLPNNDDTRMLKTCIKMLVEDIKLETYFYRYNNEVTLSDDIDNIIEMIESDADLTDDEEAQYHKSIANEYKTTAIKLAESIMNQKIDYYEVLEYSESDKKYSEFAKYAWKLVKNDFRLWKYSSYAYLKHDNFINREDPYVGLDQMFSFMYRIDETDPVFWNLDQGFQSNANEYGAECATNTIPISNPELEEHQLDMWKTFVKLFDIFDEYRRSEL